MQQIVEHMFLKRELYCNSLTVQYFQSKKNTQVQYCSYCIRLAEKESCRLGRAVYTTRAVLVHVPSPATRARGIDLVINRFSTRQDQSTRSVHKRNPVISIMYKSAGGLTSCTGLHAHYETKPTPDADCVSAFPFLTDDEFHLGCRAIEHGSHYTIRSTEPLTLSTTKTFNLGRDVEPWGEDDDVQCQEEADEEGLRDPRQDSSSVTVRFDIILSPSYRVPVVYITPSASANASRIPTMCEVRDLVVPHSYSSALEGAGVIGALSATVRIAQR